MDPEHAAPTVSTSSSAVKAVTAPLGVRYLIAFPVVATANPAINTSPGLGLLSRQVPGLTCKPYIAETLTRRLR